MVRIKAARYREFLDTGEIKLLSRVEFEQVLAQVDGIRGQYVREGRAMLILLFMSGARPCELLELKGNSFSIEPGKVLKVLIPGKKRGKIRQLYFDRKDPFIEELWKYISLCFPEQVVFYHYCSRYERKTKSGKIRIEVSDRVKYHVKKWTSKVMEGVSAYFFRHSRLSQLSEAGASAEELMHFKGSRDIRNVMPYLHLSSKRMKKLGRMVK